MGNNSDPSWQASMQIRPGLPLEMDKSILLDTREEPDELKAAVDQISPAIKLYTKTFEELLAHKYAPASKTVPKFVTQSHLIVFQCLDGVIFRYDSQPRRDKRDYALVKHTISEFAPMISEGVVFCERDAGLPACTGLNITLQRHSAAGVLIEDSAIMNVSFRFRHPEDMPPPTMPSPFCAVSAGNTLEIDFEGREYRAEGEAPLREFVLRTPLKMPVGWEAIQVFPKARFADWRVEDAPTRAEMDLQAYVIAHQTRELYFKNLDPKEAARTEKRRLFTEFQALLDSDPDREETLQVFLKQHPELLSPLVLKSFPKFALGKNVTDFILFDAMGEYTLVEIEKSTHRLFKPSDPTGLTAALNHARDQVTDWLRYIEDNLGYVRTELGLHAIPSRPKSLIVIGRSRDLDETQRRHLQTIHAGAPLLRIATYDDILVAARTWTENLLGPLDHGAMNGTRIYFRNLK